MIVVTFLVVDLDLFKEVDELCERVRKAVSKVDLVLGLIVPLFWCFELEGERKLVEVPDLSRIR